MKPRYSIIVPLYNKAPYVRKALESVLSQTYRDFELIIVDDGSTDNSAAICEEFIKQQPTSDSSLKGRVNDSFASVWGARTADSTQYDLLKVNAIANRKAPTEAEAIMWSMLKGNNLGLHFRRQHIILDYIVDFICIDKGLVIELDGGYHNEPEQDEYDRQRTAHLKQLGYTEIRFTNEELLTNPDAVIARIKSVAFSLPSFQGGEGGRLHLIRQANSGVAAARNNGVKVSKGDYVAFLDADDWWEPTFLEEIDKLINEYPDAGLYATNYVYYKPGKTHVALKLQRGYMNYPEAYLHGEMPVTSITTCMPRMVFEEIGGFPVGIKLGEDFLLWAKTAMHYPVAFCEKPLAYYNNDVPASLRATRNLHAPKHHMLFNLMPLELELARRESISPAFRKGQGVGFHLLLDKLRISGLLDYWLDNRYHYMASKELKKVDWSKHPKKVIRIYHTPIWMLKAKRRIMQIGSYWKQKLIRMKYKS